MTNKEILGELTKCHEYLYDIFNNASKEHGDGQLSAELSNKVYEAVSLVEDVYNDFYDTLDKEELRVNNLYEGKDEKIYISSDIGCGYDTFTNNEYAGSFTCADADYCWYEDEDFLIDYEEEE